ncbi:hypothetical protein QQ045_001624 [Rhodiola kirilowii]
MSNSCSIPCHAYCNIKITMWWMRIENHKLLPINLSASHFVKLQIYSCMRQEVTVLPESR